MPIEITGAHPPEHRLEVGDVIMVRRRLKDKDDPKRSFDWTYFALVTWAYRSALKCVVLDEKERQEQRLFMADPAILHVWYLPEAEWPDGVYAFRTKLILEGRIDLDL